MEVNSVSRNIRLRKHVKKLVLSDVFIWCISLAYLLISANLLYSSYKETLIFRQIVKSVTKEHKENLDDKEKFILLVRKINEIMQARQKVFENMYQEEQFSIIASADSHLQTVYGACGSYAIVLARTLQEAGYSVRLPQMYVNNKPAGHILVEADIGGQWAVADAMYNQYFIKPNHGLASFADVQRNWEMYRKQTLPNYPKEYKYENVRYANWEKIPILGTFIYNLLEKLVGKNKAQTASLRSYFLDQYLSSFFLISSMFIPLTIYVFAKRKKFKKFLLSIEIE